MVTGVLQRLFANLHGTKCTVINRSGHLAAIRTVCPTCHGVDCPEINHSQLGRDLVMTPQTAPRWLATLRATFQWFDTPGYRGNRIKRISGKPKGYLADTGLACSLQKISAASTLSGHPLAVALFETALSRSGTIYLNMVELWPVIGLVESICYRTGIHCNNCNENIPDQAFYGSRLRCKGSREA